MAGSDIDTHVGFGVITFETLQDVSTSLATTRRVISVSVMIPARPDLPITKDAAPRFFASICVTARMLSSTLDTNGFFGRSFDTGRSLVLSELSPGFLIL